jgi:3-phosphoshikimate 1-carboxyvinyltransferase
LEFGISNPKLTLFSAVASANLIPDSLTPVTIDRIEITPCGPIRAAVRPPGSKSITNRALVCAALARGQSVLRGALESEDTQVMVNALRQLGIQVAADWPQETLRVPGCDGKLPATQADLYVANSGTTVRFLAATVALARGVYRLDGTPRMRERPIGDLLEALSQLQVDATSETGTGCPPVVIRAAGLAGGKAVVRGDVSSQFLSGLLLAAPYARQPVELLVEGELVSKPYIRLTLAVMKSFGVRAAEHDLRRFEVPNRAYEARDYAIETDASAASYFFAAAAITGGEVTVEGLSRDSLQGDVAFVDCLARMGCQVRHTADRITVTAGPLTGIDVEMNAISDTVQTLGAVALFAAGPTTIRGVALRKLGADVQEFSDGLRIEPRPLRPAEIATYHDHRMAMSLALVGLRSPGVVILDPGCTSKTYPRFFEDLKRVSSSF